MATKSTAKATNLEDVYKKVEQLLDTATKNAGLKSSDVTKYYKPVYSVNNKSQVFERFAITLQNTGLMHNSIKYMNGNGAKIKKLCCNFDADIFVKTYKSDVGFYNAFVKIIPNNGTGKTKSNVQKYCEGIYDFVSKYLAAPSGYAKLKNMVSPSTKIDVRNKFSDLVDFSKTVRGVGIALACDFFKEIGCEWLTKPDTHIVDFCVAVAKSGLFKDNQGYSTNINATVKNKISKEVIVCYFYEMVAQLEKTYKGLTVYKFDKMVWLVSTQDFYLDKKGLKNKELKKQLLDYIF